jgi:hypothetical protein
LGLFLVLFLVLFLDLCPVLRLLASS